MSDLFDNESDTDNCSILPSGSPNSSELFDPFNSSEAEPSPLISRKREPKNMKKKAFPAAGSSTGSELYDGSAVGDWEVERDSSSCKNGLFLENQTIREDDNLGCATFRIGRRVSTFLKW